MMSANIASLLYLACGVLFILALRGLSSPVTSRRGNQMGMIGMAIAVAVTLAVGREAKTTCAARVALPRTPDDNPWARRGDQWLPSPVTP